MRLVRVFLAGTLSLWMAAQNPALADDLDVKSFGAVGDGKADDTAAVQKAIDAAAEAGGTLLFPPGTYAVTSVGLRPGVRYTGYGATIKRPANQGKWIRTFDAGAPGYLYSSDEDSPPLTLEGFTFDGNRREQSAYAEYQLEQAHLVNLVADPERKGRLRVRIRDCHFQHGVGDAISVYTNVDLKVSACTARDCFRGGLTVTGGYSRVQATDFATMGEDHATGIDVEVDGGGYGGSHGVEVTLENLMLHDGDFDVGVAEDSIVLGSNIVAPRAPFNVYGGGTATLKFSNCIFGVGEFSSGGNRIVLPGDTSFSHCTFRIDGKSDENARKWAAAHVYWSIGDTATARQTLAFADCKFEASEGIAASDSVYALYVEADQPQNDNLLTVRGGQIGAEFDYGLYMSQGGRSVVKDVVSRAETTLHLGASERYPLDVTVDGVEAPECDTYLHMVTHVAESRLTHRNVLLDEKQNVIGTNYGIVGNEYRGGRTILGDRPPTEATPGLLHDVYRLRTPIAGEVYEWVCTAPGTGGEVAWKAAARLEK